jgi:hypothetical protein
MQPGMNKDTFLIKGSKQRSTSIAIVAVRNSLDKWW